jgi:hypothetical protein
MRIKTLSTFLTLSLCGAALAWQFDPSTLGLTPKDLEARAAGGLRDNSGEVQVPWLSAQGKTAAKALSEADRAEAVRVIGAALKSIVSSPAFQKAHDESIKSGRRAVNHGIKVQPPGAANMADMQKQMMAQTVLQLRGNPITSLKAMHQDSLKSWTRQAETATQPQRKAKYQKLAARALEIQPLAESNPDEFKKAFTVLFSIDNDGPDTEEAIVTLASRGKQEEEQRSYDQYNWKTVLTKKLQSLVKEAATVDFAAQTTQVAGRTKFVNPAYERKSSLWKAMFRAGKAPTLAAAEFSKAWLKEL